MKNRLAKILFTVESDLINRCLAKYSANKLTILAYHRVIDINNDTYPFDEEIISSNTKEFETQLIFLKKYFNVINFNDLLKYINNGDKLPERSVIITFDDGYYDNYEVAFPMLKKHNLKATIFITTGLINTNKIFWFEKISYWIKHTNVNDFSILNGKYKIVIDKNRKSAILAVLNILKTVNNADRLIAMKEIEHSLNVEIDPSFNSLVLPLNREQIKEMDLYGIEIGSHTVNHSILSKLNENEIYYELYESKKTIENILNHKIISLSYPVGNEKSYDNRVINIAKECGYKFGITYNNKSFYYDESQNYHIPRIHVETSIDLSLFKGNILIPSIFL